MLYPSDETVAKELKKLLLTVRNGAFITPVVTKIIAIRATDRAAFKEKIEYIVGRDWEPAYKPESDEEKGFQKGLIAEHRLVKRRAEESLTTLLTELKKI